ncbi:MAG: PAS domain-containing sensor histidine kinase [Burkholderiaceae bacterium]|nr:PAS domain-containing sensor histidine kinase [Burkholderiaceae bacterium]
MSDGSGDTPSPWYHLPSWFGQDRFAHLAPLVAVVLFLAVVLSAFWFLRLEEAGRAQEALKRDAEYSQQRLRLRLQERQEQLMRLARDIANREVNAGQFVVRAESLAAQYPELVALSWINARPRVVAAQVSPSINAARGWMDDDALKAGAVEKDYGRARSQLQPVYSQPMHDKEIGSVLLFHVPIVAHGQFVGELLTEYSVDALLRYGVPTEILAKYAAALLDGQGRLLAGQSVPDRPNFWQRLPYGSKVNEFQIPVGPAGGSLVLRTQAWRTSQGMVSNTLFWLATLLASMTTWMLLVNWQQSRRRQQARQALQAETSFRRAMENSMLTGMRALDMQGRITYVNPAFCQMTGWSEDDLLGQPPPYSYWPAEDRQLLTERLNDEMHNGTETGALQMRVKRKNGSLFDARLYVSPLLDANGKQTGWMGSMTDITEPNRVRRQLSASHARFTTVLEALDASVSVAPLGSEELLFANKLYRQWFDGSTSGHMDLVVRAGTLQTTSSDENLAEIDSSFVGLTLDSLAASPSAEQAEVYIESLGKWLEVRSRYLNWVDGRLAQMVIATDITARRRAEEQAAAQAERAQTVSRLIAMGEMASSVAHELNQPLTAISNYCTGMLSRLRGNAISQDDLLGTLEKTARQAHRAGQVVQHIRDFVKRSEPNRQWAEVPTMVEQVVELAEIDLRRRQVKLTHHVDADLPPLFVDPILIEQVLLNLIKNGAESIEAARRVPGNRAVHLRVMQRNVEGMAVTRFVVTDTGRGLAPEVIGRLYEAFFSTKSEGLGIGLNLCRSIIESHQGRIAANNLYNSGQIVGCRFCFWIPVGSSLLGALTPPSTSDKILA